MMGKLRRAPFALMLLLALAACGAAHTPPIGRAVAAASPDVVPTLSPVLPPARYQADISSNIAYGPLAGETLDLCQPQDATTPRPGVILIHGGGWTNGDKSQFASLCPLLASEGFVAAAVNYRLTPAHIWPAQIVDVQLAVRFLRAQARQFMLDPTRLCSWGDSSGGHLAVFLGVLATIHPGDEATLLANQSSAVSCTIDDFGITNFLTYGVTPAQKGLLQLLLGGATLKSNPALYRDASPIFQVSPRSAPMLIIQGTQDTVVPPEQSLSLQQALQNNAVPVQYLSYVGGHEYSGAESQKPIFDAESISFLIAYEHP